MITISAKRSAKCDAETRKPACAGDKGADDIEHQCSKPHIRAGVAVDEPTEEHDESGAEEPRSEPEQGAPLTRIIADTPAEERDVENAHGEVRDREPDALVLIRVGYREGHEERCGHGHQHDESHNKALDVDRVRHPRVRGPGPPDEREHESGSGEPRRARVLEDQQSHLCKREHEDEVEEELEVAGLAFLFLRSGLAREGCDIAHR